MNYRAISTEQRNGCTIITLEFVNRPKVRKKKHGIRIWAVGATASLLSAALVFTLGCARKPQEVPEANENGQLVTLTDIADAYSKEKPAIIPAVEWVNDDAAEVEEPTAPVSIGVYTITAYCACEKCCGKTPDDPWYGITATGTKATQGRTIAVDPRVIPYGTVLYFEGPDGCISGYVAEDCGGSIKGNRIDLYFDSHAAALEWGVRDLEVYWIKENTNEN